MITRFLCLEPTGLRTLRSLNAPNRPFYRLQLLRTIPSSPTCFQVARHASTTNETATNARSLVTRLKNFMFGTSIILGLTFTYLYITDTRSSIHRWGAVPLLRYFVSDAETAHELGTRTLKTLHAFGLHPRERTQQSNDLTIEVFGQMLDSPVGTSAGIDKNGDIPSALLALGPAVVEVGGTTPYPQEGNAKPRVFRIPSQNALINRYGLNSEGAEHLAMQLRQRLRRFADSVGLGSGEDAERRVLDGEAGVPPGSLVSGKLLAVQVAKNKSTPDNDINAVRADYVFCVEKLAKYADIIVVNVSSPNTPGLRSLQKAEPLEHILGGVVQAARSVTRKNKPAVMVKVSPDEDQDEDILGICQAVWATGVDGVIVGNTTKKRPSPIPENRALSARETELLLEQGGYSGPQMFERTLTLVKKYRSVLDEALLVHHDKQLEPKVIFATGGITNGKQALDVLQAGASVAMVYTALIYGGIGTISLIKDQMREEIRKTSK